MRFEIVNEWHNATCEDGVVYFSNTVLDVPAHPDTDPLLTLIQDHGYDTYVETEEGLFAIVFEDKQEVHVTQLHESL